YPYQLRRNLWFSAGACDAGPPRDLGGPQKGGAGDAWRRVAGRFPAETMADRLDTVRSAGSAGTGSGRTGLHRGSAEPVVGGRRDQDPLRSGRVLAGGSAGRVLQPDRRMENLGPL